jgi:hypothetical protein
MNHWKFDTHFNLKPCLPTGFVGHKFYKSTITNMTTVQNSEVIFDQSNVNRICTYVRTRTYKDDVVVVVVILISITYVQLQNLTRVEFDSMLTLAPVKYAKPQAKLHFILRKYEGVSKSFRTGRLERELQMAQLSANRCSCIAIL